MGSSFSQQLLEAKEREGNFIVEGVHIKSKEIPSLIKKLLSEIPTVSIIELTTCKIKKLPSNVNLIHSLISLNLVDNRISSLPSEFSGLVNLQDVDFSGNSFSRFPMDLSSLPNLRAINFSRNQISVLPNFSVKDFPTLQTLNFEKNEFSSFPTSILSLTSIRILNMNFNKINNIPFDDFSRLKDLQEIHFRGNVISTISRNFSQILEITHLDLSENQIKEIPAQINQLSRLITLELQHNQITTIPDELFTLESLSCLKLSDNQISIIPEQIGNLVNLTELYLRENRIKELPPAIGKLSNLRKLYFEFNNLQVLPVEISELKKLVVLILHHNNLSTLPDCLCTMGSLLRLSLDDNPLDEKILQIIKDEGALSLIQRVEGKGSEEGRKSFRASTLRRSFRNGDQQQNTQPNLSRSVSIKSISELTATKTNSIGSLKVTKKNSNNEAAVPSYSKFKFAFDNLLEEQDFSQKKKEILKKLPEGEKWNLLSQYKGSTLNLIRNSNSTPAASSGGKGRLLSKTNSATRNEQKGPKDYIPLLKENRANKNTMERIKMNLKQNVSDWVSKFIDASGIPAIISFLRLLFLKKPQSARDLSFMVDCLEIMQILIGVSLKSFLTTSGAVEAVTMGLYSNFTEVKLISVNILDTICQDESVAAMLVLEALSSLSVEFEEEFRFMPLIQFLESGLPDMANLTCLSLINFIIDSVEDLNERFQIRMEFMTMGFKEILSNLPQGILFDIQKSNFDQQTANDYEDMICRKQAASNAQIINKIQKKNLSEGKLSISLITEKVHTTFEIQTADNMLISDLILQIVQKNKIESVSEYGLFDSQSATPNDCLPDDFTIKDCNLASNQLEFKMRDWDLSIFITTTNQVVSLSVNPQFTTEHVVKELISSTLISNGSYCLKIDVNGILIRLEDTKPLISIDLLRDKINWKSLILEENPIQLKVFLAEDTWQIMEFNLHIKIFEIFQKIITHAGLNINPNDYCLILVDKTSDSSSLLDFENTLSIYEISDPDNCCLKLTSKQQTEVANKTVVDDDEEEEVEECNIWDEPPDSSENITFEQGKEKAIQNIETASLNKLVERVTSADEYDVDFVNVFVLMFHGFTTEEKLWNKLLERFEVPETIEEAIKMKIRARVCIFIKNWVEKDLLSPHVRSLIQQFVTTRMTDPQYSLMSKVILDRLNNPKGNEEMQISEKPPIPLLPRNVFAKLTIFDIEDLEIARQMTVYLFNIYRKIRPRELFRSAWNKEKLKHLSQNVLSMIDYYNKISNSISTCIVMESKVRNRTRLMEKVISIAEKLRDLNNFHLLSAFISAINNSAILRLKYTKARISKKARLSLTSLEETMSMDSSFVHYRNALAAAKPPCIPFMGVYLTDLTFIADGNPDRIQRRINFVKQKFVYSVIATIKAYQTTPYNLDEVDSIQQFIHNLPTLPDKDIYALSLQIEPRNADRGDIQ